MLWEGKPIPTLLLTLTALQFDPITVGSSQELD